MSEESEIYKKMILMNLQKQKEINKNNLKIDKIEAMKIALFHEHKEKYSLYICLIERRIFSKVC